jgi:hypothetical protein
MFPVHDHHVRRCQLPDLAENRTLARNHPETQEILDGGRVD